MGRIQNLEYILVHLDGVLLKNILGPILYSMMNSFKIQYTLEVERNILARPLEEIGNYLRTVHKISLSNHELFETYLTFRSEYERNTVIHKQNGLIDFLNRIQALGLKLIAYGGAPKEYFNQHLSELLNHFIEPRYIQTRDFRPGLIEIMNQLNVSSHQIIFIDEEANVGRVAISNKIPFIGFEDNFAHSFQPLELKSLNLDYSVSCLHEITEDLLLKIDSSLNRLNGKY